MNYKFEGTALAGRSGVEDRVAFLRSVYLWLMGGFIVAGLGAVTAPFLFRPIAAITGRFFFYILLFGQFGALIWAQAVSRRQSQNKIAFGAYTYLSGAIAGLFALAIAAQAGLGVVIAAFGMTVGAFLSLTLTAFVTRRDFSFLRSFVLVGFVIAIIGSIVGFFMHLPTLSLLVSVIVVLACSAKILWDTSAMLRTSDYGNPAGFALSLFISLYLIFIHLLNLLGGRRS